MLFQSERMKNYIQCDQYMHQLTQLLARTNKAFQRAKPDDSHTNVFFEPLSNRIYGRRMMIPDSGLQFYPAIDVIESLFLIVDSHGKTSESIPLTEKSFEETLLELAALWRKMGLDTLPFEQPLHYDIPVYPFANGALTSPAKENLETWLKLRSIANEALGTLESSFLAESKVRIWPHHFDTGVFLQVTDDEGIGAGLAMADEVCETPYFYLSGQLTKGDFDYGTPQSKTGIWRLKGDWKGALLPATKELMIDSREVYLWLNNTAKYIRNRILVQSNE
ncbi:MAG: hypothetical protein ACI8TS_001747 [Flavobacteriales bacterium]